MNKHIYLFSLLFVFAIQVFVPATAQTISPEPIGRWTSDTSKSIKEISTSRKREFDSLSDQQKTRLRKVIESRVYEFKKDGGFFAEWEFNGNKQQVSGMWKMKEKNILIIALSTGNTEYHINMDGNILMLNPIKVSKGMRDKLFFTKEL